MRKSNRGFYVVLVVVMISLASCSFNIPEVDLPFLPTETYVPAPTSTPLPTPTYPPKLEINSELYQIEVLENDETIFIDKEFGYQIKFPAEWLVIPPGADLQEDLAGELSEQMQQLVVITRRKDGLRTLALDYTLTYNQTENSIANFNIVFQKDLAAAATELENLLEDNATLFPTLVPDSMVTYQAIQTNSAGIEYAKMVISYPASTNGTALRQIVMMVKLDEGMLVITATAEESMYDKAEPAFLRAFNSLTWVE